MGIGIHAILYEYILHLKEISKKCYIYKHLEQIISKKLDFELQSFLWTPPNL